MGDRTQQFVLLYTVVHDYSRTEAQEHTGTTLQLPYSGKLRMAEPLPIQHGDSRLTLHNGQYHLVVTYPAQQRPGRDPRPRGYAGPWYSFLSDLFLGISYRTHWQE